MKDSFKQERKSLRPGYSTEFRGKNDKSINRRIARKRLKNRDKKSW